MLAASRLVPDILACFFSLGVKSIYCLIKDQLFLQDVGLENSLRENAVNSTVNSNKSFAYSIFSILHNVLISYRLTHRQIIV